MFSRIGSAAFKKDLTNTKLLCEALGNPQNSFKSIHVGGTNGKGSVSHMLAAIFQTAGYKTGLYTSPHLYDFRERIKLNGEMIPEEFVIDFVEKVKPLTEQIEPSFFEITVAMAFHYFAKQQVDIAIIEVGLGGRLDSTNVITPELSIITNIGWDHMNMLGNSLEEIASEKAGIIKEEVPVVIGETLRNTKPVFESTAIEKNAPIYFADKAFAIKNVNLSTANLTIHYTNEEEKDFSITTDLTGVYQAKNVRTVLAALPVLAPQYPLLNKALPAALLNVKGLTGLSGRWEVISHNPTVVLEVAHNKEGIEQMLKHLALLPFQQLHVIIGVVKDKDIEPILMMLPGNAAYYFTEAHIPRALTAVSLQQKAHSFQLMGDVYNDVNIAVDAAIERANDDDLIIVCGSIFLVAEVDKKRLF